MTVSELLTFCRGQLDDKKGAGTPLWSDDELVAYLNYAEQRIAEECLVLRDSVTASDANGDPVCVIPVAATNNVYTNTYDIHPSIIKIFGVSYGTNRTSLTLTSRDVLDRIRPTWRTQTGTPQYYIIDATTGQLVLDRVPTADSNIYLSAARLPLIEMSRARLTDSPSLPTKYHRKLINGVLGQAYLKQDVETLNMNKATLFNGQFEKDIEQIKRSELRLYRGALTALRSIY